MLNDNVAEAEMDTLTESLAVGDNEIVGEVVTEYDAVADAVIVAVTDIERLDDAHCETETGAVCVPEVVAHAVTVAHAVRYPDCVTDLLEDVQIDMVGDAVNELVADADRVATRLSEPLLERVIETEGLLERDVVADPVCERVVDEDVE